MNLLAKQEKRESGDGYVPEFFTTL